MECSEIQSDCAELGEVTLQTLCAEVNGVRVLTLGSIREETARDKELTQVARAVETGEWPQ